MSAFERQLAGEISGLMGPVRPVDDLAVFDAVIAATYSSKRRFWSATMPFAGGSHMRVTGRTQVMLSPVRAIIAGALVFALGGVFLIAQPFDQQGPVVPAAQMTEQSGATVSHVTGTIIDTSYDPSTGELVEAPGDINHMSGATYVETNEWSDPRLPAEKKMKLDFTTYPYEGGRLMVTRTSIRMDDPDGSWVGTGVGLSYPDGTSHGQDVLVGEGAYAGLFAVLNCGTDMGCEGFIFEGEMPPTPDPMGPPAE